MGHFGFSYVGFIWLLMLFIPNLLWTKRKPEGYSADGENKFLAALERIGEVLVCCAALVFSDFNLRALEPLADRLFSFDALLRNMVDQVFFGRTEAA